MAEENEVLFGLEFKIDSFEDTSLTNGEKAFIIYLKIDNKTPKSRKINLLKTTYVTNKREQLEQDIWLSGYIVGEDTLKPDSFKKAGLIFYKSKLKTISDNDVIYISIELTQEGRGLTLCFQKTVNNWVITNKEKTEIEIKLIPKQLEKNLLNCIERLEAFEENIGVTLGNFSVKATVYSDNSSVAEVFFELRPITGTQIKKTINIQCISYSHDGSILDKDGNWVSPDNFFGFETFCFTIPNPEKISKLRIFPKK